MDRLKARIRAAARHLGFTLCGFARVEPLPRGEFVREWLSAGNAAGMHYIERGLATLECGHSVIRIAPPLVLTAAEAATGLRIFGEAVAEVAGK